VSQPSNGPLTDADRKKINDRLRDLENLQRDIELAEQAKCPIGDEGAQCRFLKERLMLLKQTYFPNMP
jgi:hypothetical protein